MNNQDKEKHFQRQRNRLQRQTKKEGVEEQTHNISSSASENKKQLLTDRPKVQSTISSFTQRIAVNLPISSQEALKRLINVNKGDFAVLLKDKIFRQQFKKQEKRLTKVRNDQKLPQQSQLQLSFLAINGLLSASEQVINQYIKQKQPKPKPTVRVNQEKQMSKQLSLIDEQIALNNYGAVKTTIQGLLKRFGKDQFLEQKVGYLTYIQTLTQELQRQSNLFKQCSLYLQKISSIETSSPESSLLSSTSLKNFKKELNISLNKQNKKQEPSQRITTLLTQFDKVSSSILSFIEPKPEKKPLKGEGSASKQIEPKNQGTQFLQQANKYLKQLLDKTTQDKELLYKQLQALKKNKKKSIESPFNFVIRLFDLINSSKREVNDFNNYLKSVSQLYLRKNISSENLAVQIKKIEEKFSNNEVINILKTNLEGLISSVQQKQRSGKQSIGLEQEIKRIKLQNEKNLKIIEEQKGKIVQKIVEDQKVDKKKEMEERRQKEAEKVKAEKFQKELQRNIETIFSNLVEKKYKIAKNSINVFVKKYEQMPNPIIPRSIQSFNAINSLITDLQAQELQNVQFDKRQKTLTRQNQKQKQALNQKLKTYEQYEGIVKTILENFNQEKYPLKKIFDDLRRDRKKIIQEKYLLLAKLQDLINFWRNKKIIVTQEKTGSLEYSMTIGQSDKIKRELTELQQKFKELQNKSAQTNKDVQQLLSLVKKIEKGGQWWKFIPKSLKNNTTFKSIYAILEQYRKYELNIEALKTKQSLNKQQAQVIEIAIDFIIGLMQKDHLWIAEDEWQKKLTNFKGKQGYDKLITLLKLLSLSATTKISEECQSLKIQIERLQRNQSDRHKSMSNIDESASKKSTDLRSSRKSSRSRDKVQVKSKELIQSYIQDERTYLSKIDESERQKLRIKQQLESIQLKSRAIEQQLFKSEEKCHQLQLLKNSLEKEKYQQFNQINNLKGELQIAQGRIIEIQSKYETELNQYKQLYNKVSEKIGHQAAKSKKLESQNLSLKKQVVTIQGSNSEKQTDKSQANIGQHVVQKMQGIKYRINLDTQKVFELVQTDGNIREKARKRLESLKKSGKKEQEQKVQQKVETAPQQSKQADFAIQISLLKQKQEYFISQNNRLLLIITDLTTENNSLKIQLSNLLASNNQNQSDLSQIQKLKLQIIDLKHLIEKLQSQHIILIQKAIQQAVQRQADNFNAYHQKILKDQEIYFLTVVVPEKLKEQLSKIKSPVESPAKIVSYQLDINSEQFLNLYKIKSQADKQDFEKRLQQELNIRISIFMEKQFPVILQSKRAEMKIEFDLILQNERKLWIQLQNERKVSIQPQHSADFLQIKQQYQLLRQEYQIFKKQKQIQMKNAVDAAVLRQVQSFNQFLATNQKQQQHYYLNVVLPQKIQEQLAKIKSPSKSQTYHIDINSQQFLNLYQIKIQSEQINFQLRLQNELTLQTSLFLQNQLPIIIQNNKNEWKIQYDNDRIMWELIKADEWLAREIVINNFWLKLLEEKQKQWYFRYEQKIQIQISPKKEVEYHFTQTQLLQILKKQEYSSVLTIIINDTINDTRIQWQKTRQIQWISRQKQLEGYWQNVVIPKLHNDWDLQKKKQIQALKLSSQNNNPEIIIEQWKSMFLQSIIQYERLNAIQLFKQHELPKILQNEYNIWKLANSKQLQVQIQNIEVNYQIQLKQWQQRVFLVESRAKELQSQIKLQQDNWIIERNTIINSSVKNEVIIQIQQTLETERRALQQEVKKNQLLVVQLNNWKVKCSNLEQKQAQYSFKIQQLQANYLIRLQKQVESTVRTRLVTIQNNLTIQNKSNFDVQLQARLNQLQVQIRRQIQVSLRSQIEVEIRKSLEIELRRTLEVQLRRVLEIDLRQTLYLEVKNSVEQQVNGSLQQNFNSKLEAQRSIWQRAKQQEISRILSIEISEWEKHKQNQIAFILTTSKNEWQLKKQEEINKILIQERKKWLQQQTQTFNRKLSQQNTKWQLIIRQKEEESKGRVVTYDQQQNIKLMQLQKQYNEVRIPQILQAQYQIWLSDYNQNLQKERQNWLKDIPQLLNSEAFSIHLENYKKSFLSEYQQKFRIFEVNLSKLQSTNKQLISEKNRYQSRINQLTNEISLTSQRYLEVNLQKQQLEQHLVKIKTDFSQQINQVNYQTTQKITQSNSSVKQIEQLKKIISKQSDELKNLELLAKENSRLKQESLALREANSILEKNKWREVNQIRQKLQLKILELTNERTSLITKISTIQVGRHEISQNQTILSLERQIATLEATIRTKDTQIAFLKRAIDTNKDELRQSREQYTLLYESKKVLEKQIGELRNSKLEVQYEVKFLQQREDNLKKKLEMKEQELTSMRKKEDLQSDILQKKTKSSLQTITTYQLKISEIESVLTLKNQECQAAFIQVERLRYELQRSQANTHAVAHQLETFKLRSKDIEAQLIQIRSERDRGFDELNRLKQSLNQYLARQQELNRQLMSQSRLAKQSEGERMRIQTQLQKLNEQITRLLRELSENERVTRKQAEKAMQLERQLRQVRNVGVRNIDPAEIQVLSKINNQVSQLTATNRQLTMKILLLQNRDKVLNFSPDITNFFLLMQKHTDYLLDFLLKQAIIPNLQPYHRFLAESRPFLAAGQLPLYFAKWQTLLRELFESCVKSKAQQLRSQAEELLRLKEEMNDVLQRQIQASESDAGQLVEDYKLVLMDIKSLVKQYISSGDREYLSLLCSSLGIGQK